MTKAEFIDKLCKGLRFHSDPDEIQKTVMFYSEAIDDRMEDGLTEEEAVEAMGSIDDIVREFHSSWKPEDGGDGGSVRPGEVKRVFPTAVVRRIEIYDTSGDIDILPSPDGNIHIEYTASELWRYEITGDSTVTVRRAKNGHRDEQVRFDFFGREFSFTLPNFNGAFSNELRLRLCLPAASAPAVSVNSASGDVECRDVTPAELFIKLASGDVTVNDLESAGKVSVITVSGDVELGNVSTPELSAATVSGDINAERVQAGAMNIKSVSGDTHVEDAAVSERLAAGSVSGDLTMALTVPCRHLGVDSVSGDVRLRLAGADNLYTVTTKTNSGDVRVQGLPSSGPNPVRIKTMSGDIGVEFGG